MCLPANSVKLYFPDMFAKIKAFPAWAPASAVDQWMEGVVIRVPQDLRHNLWDLIKMKMWGLLLKKIRISRCNSRALNQTGLFYVGNGWAVWVGSGWAVLWNSSGKSSTSLFSGSGNWPWKPCMRWRHDTIRVSIRLCLWAQWGAEHMLTCSSLFLQTTEITELICY